MLKQNVIFLHHLYFVFKFIQLSLKTGQSFGISKKVVRICANASTSTNPDRRQTRRPQHRAVFS